MVGSLTNGRINMTLVMCFISSTSCLKDSVLVLEHFLVFCCSKLSGTYSPNKQNVSIHFKSLVILLLVQGWKNRWILPFIHGFPLFFMLYTLVGGKGISMSINQIFGVCWGWRSIAAFSGCTNIDTPKHQYWSCFMHWGTLLEQLRLKRSHQGDKNLSLQWLMFTLQGKQSSWCWCPLYPSLLCLTNFSISSMIDFWWKRRY